MVKLKSFFEKTLGLTTKEIVGLLFGVVAFFIACGSYDYTKIQEPWLRDKLTYVEITGVPGFSDALLSVAFMAIIYLRGIIRFKNVRVVGLLLTIVINVAMFASFFALITCSMEVTKENTSNVVWIGAIVFCVTSLLLCQKGIAKVVVLLSIAIFCIDSLNNIDNAMGFAGFLYVIFIFMSFFLQGNVGVKELFRDLKYLYGRTTDMVSESVDEGVDEIGQAGSKIIETVASSTKLKKNK